MAKYVYDWKPDPADVRDFTYAPEGLNLPLRVDLRETAYMPKMFDQGRCGSCFPAGTRVRMADGRLTPIEQIRTLDQVLTAEGNIGLVTNTMVRRTTELVKLNIWGHNHLKLTPEHPVLTRRGYVPAKDLVPGDQIAFPRHLPSLYTEFETQPFLAGPRRITTMDRKSGSVAGHKTASIKQCVIPKVIQLNANTGRIFGLFLAEGSTDLRKVVWTFGSHELTTHVADLVRILREEWGVEARVQQRPNNTAKVVVDGVQWAQLFVGLCATGSGRKFIHPYLAAAPRACQEALLTGWLDGDGYNLSKKRSTMVGHQGVTVSHDLALGMYHLASGLGYNPVVRRSQPTMNKHAATRRIRWDVTVSIPEDSYRMEAETDYVWRTFRYLTTEPVVDMWVYNFSVTSDESYVAEGIGVHNCVAHAVAGMLQYLDNRTDGHSVALSRMWLYYQARKLEGMEQYDAGCWIRDAMKVARKLGVPPEQAWPYRITRYADEPPESVYTAAAEHRLGRYARVPQDEKAMCEVLAKGQPIVLGIQVFEQLESDLAKLTGTAFMPPPYAWSLGGHAVVVVGYNVMTRTWAIRNSWGVGWGKAGYFTLPWDYLLDPGLTQDLWTASRY